MDFDVAELGDLEIDVVDVAESVALPEMGASVGSVLCCSSSSSSSCTCSCC
ncbi:thiazolylpeptide-type bacteriocin [Rathayibacter toxicus]|uniref:thiazolylpeptide-type bacteriocin n=1 Tax=Rathayibacter toxicus TaxID=145458 RepID=UPI001C049804|nr:thiazolylpeptide-type bacteriocin [Rathayibacter toxicus]